MKLKDILWVIILTLLSPLLTGYYFGILDHDHYLPYLNKLLNPSLYQGDYYFSQPHGNYSWFDYLIIFLKKITGLDLAWTNLILYLLTLGIFYLGIYWLAKTLYRRTGAAVLVVIFLLLPKWASQIGYMTHHFYFVSRDLSLGLSLLAINFILQKKLRFSLILLVLAFFVNPSVPIPVIILLPFTFHSLNFAFLPFNADWWVIMQRRGTYSFPLLWHWMGWGTLLYYLSLLGLAWQVLRQKLFGQFNQTIQKLLLICGGLFLFHLVISSLLPVPDLIQLQLLRSVNFIFIFSLIALAGAIYQLLTHGGWALKLASALAAISLHFWGDHLTIWHILLVWQLSLIYLIISHKTSQKSFPQLPIYLAVIILLAHLTIKLAVIKPRVNLPDYWYYPNPLVDLSQFSSWRQVQDWARLNTPLDALFLVPPQWSGFRSFSERSIVTDAKDGGVIFYSSAYAQTWQARNSSLENYQNFTQADFINLSQLYHFTYFVVTADHPLLNFQLQFKNQGFTIYKI